MTLIQCVEQRALELGAARAAMLLRDARLDRLAQLGERLQSHLLGEFVVGREVARRLDALGGHVE